MPTASDRYVIVSPVRDEEVHLEQTLRSVIAQTVRPLRWVIVDDGSCDRTPDILREYASKYSWIEVSTLKRAGRRRSGSPVVTAFNAGFERVRGLDFEFVVKLDCDVLLAPDYFEQLLARFYENAALGIASGVYAERGAVVKMPEYHAAGASKMIRATCFAQIGGFVAAQGWDTVDEIRAQTFGWQTTHFEDLQFQHLRAEGSANGLFRTSFMHGKIYYLTGGGGLFLIVKTLHRAWAGKPPVLAAIALLSGFLTSWIASSRRLVSDNEARHYRSLLNHRLLQSVRAGMQRMGVTMQARGGF